MKLLKRFENCQFCGKQVIRESNNSKKTTCFTCRKEQVKSYYKKNKCKCGNPAIAGSDTCKVCGY